MYFDGADIVFLKGEDEAALKQAFVEACAQYHPDHTYSMIGRFVFEGLPKGEMRGDQAGVLWGNDLRILERIKILKLDKTLLTPLTYEQLLSKCIETAEDRRLPSTEKRARIDAFRLYAEMQGFIKDDKAKKALAVPAGMPTINFVPYDD